MKRYWIMFLLIFCLLLCACGAAAESAEITLEDENLPTVQLQLPEGFETVDRSDPTSAIFRHKSLGNLGYLYVVLLDGDYQELAANGLSDMISNLAPTAHRELTIDETGSPTTAWFSMQYEYVDEAGTGSSYSRIAAAYASVKDSTVLVMANAFAETEDALCDEMQLLDYVTQTAATLHTDD